MGSETSLTLLGEQMDWAKAAAVSNILPDAYRSQPGNILVAINYGASMGLQPAESLYRIHVIKGRPTMSAELIAAQVRKHGHKLHIYKDYEHQSVTAEIIRSDDPDFKFVEKRDMDWAKRMGLAGKDNWRKDPMTMLKWRAITAVAREACPETLYGAGYTPDEMDDLADVTVPPQQDSSPMAPYANKEQLDSVVAAFRRAGNPGGLPKHWRGMVLASLLGDGRERVEPKELTFEQAATLLSGGVGFLAQRIGQTMQTMFPTQAAPAPEPEPQQETTPNPEPQQQPDQTATDQPKETQA
ncbi:hypothetical protein [Bifidobacterium apri]